MVTEAGTPGIQKQIVKPQNLKGMEARYEHALQELADAVKVPTQTIQKRRDRSMKVPLTPRGNCVYSNNNLLLSPQEEKHWLHQHRSSEPKTTFYFYFQELFMFN